MITITVQRPDGTIEEIAKPEWGTRMTRPEEVAKVRQATRAAGRGEVLSIEDRRPAPNPEAEAYLAYVLAVEAARSAERNRFEDGGTGLGFRRAAEALARAEAARAAYLATYGEGPSLLAAREQAAAAAAQRAAEIEAARSRWD